MIISFFVLLFAGLDNFLDSTLCFNHPKWVKINMDLALKSMIVSWQICSFT
jgi:hypothetical protein